MKIVEQGNDVLGQKGEKRWPLGAGDIWPEGASQKEKHSGERKQQAQRPWDRNKLASLKNKKTSAIEGAWLKGEWRQVRLGTGEACRPGTKLWFYSGYSGSPLEALKHVCISQLGLRVWQYGKICSDHNCPQEYQWGIHGRLTRDKEATEPSAYSSPWSPKTS